MESVTRYTVSATETFAATTFQRSYPYELLPSRLQSVIYASPERGRLTSNLLNDAMFVAELARVNGGPRLPS
jgi:hypothetical protein